ncbi:hypothetical protein WDU94_002509 [Cyamophila willieti]
MLKLLRKSRRKANSRLKESIHWIGHRTNKSINHIIQGMRESNSTTTDTTREIGQEAIAITKSSVHEISHEANTKVRHIDTITTQLNRDKLDEIDNIAAQINKNNLSIPAEDRTTIKEIDNNMNGNIVYETRKEVNTPVEITVKPTNDKDPEKKINGWMREFHNDKYKVALEEHHRHIEELKREFKNKWKPLVGDLVQESKEESMEDMERERKKDMYDWEKVLKEDEENPDNAGINEWQNEYGDKINHHWVMPKDFYDDPDPEMTRERYKEKYGENSIKEGTLTDEEEEELMDRISRGEDINESREHPRTEPDFKKLMDDFRTKLMGKAVTKKHDGIKKHGVLANNTATKEQVQTEKEGTDLLKKHGVLSNDTAAKKQVQIEKEETDLLKKHGF